MTPEERRALMHEARERIRWVERRCGACYTVQSKTKLAEIETLPDDGHWACEHCGREHCIV